VTAVHGGEFCTYMAADRFFSHRREAPCGRMASLVWLAP
jgi:copper oxidase (laccase) domain-containing protein